MGLKHRVPNSRQSQNENTDSLLTGRPRQTWRESKRAKNRDQAIIMTPDKRSFRGKRNMNALYLENKKNPAYFYEHIGCKR